MVSPEPATNVQHLKSFLYEAGSPDSRTFPAPEDRFLKALLPGRRIIQPSPLS